MQADKFQKNGKALRRKMWWQNVKMKIVLGLIVLMALFIIFLVVSRGAISAACKRFLEQNGLLAAGVCQTTHVTCVAPCRSDGDVAS